MTAGYKETPIGKIPEDWEVVRLGGGGVAEIRKNKSVNNVEKIAFIPMEYIPDSSIYTKYEIRNLNEVKSSTYCEAGDLLLAKITPSLENGKQGIVPENIPNGFALATTEVFPIVCKGIDRLFLFYILKHPRFRKVLEHSMRGTTGRQRVPKEAVENLLIPYPPLEEQRKIAEILSTVDKVIQKVDEAIAKTERLKKGLMQELLTKGIGHTEFKDTEIGRIPKEWEVVTLNDVAEISTGTTPSTKNPEYYDGDIPFIKTTEIDNNLITEPKTFITEKAVQDYNLKVFPPNTVLIAMYGQGKTRGKVALVKIHATTSQNAAILILNKRVSCPSYVWYYLMSKYSELRRTGIHGQISHLNLSFVRKFRIPLPPLPEQQKIAEILSTIDRKLELEKKRKGKLERIKKGLMNDLLTGRRRVEVEING